MKLNSILLIKVTFVVFFFDIFASLMGGIAVAEIEQGSETDRRHHDRNKYAQGHVLVLATTNLGQENKHSGRGSFAGLETAIEGEILSQSRISKTESVFKVKLPQGLSVEQAINQKWEIKDPRILVVEPDYYVYPAVMPNDPFINECWGLNNVGQSGGTSDADIDAPEAWDITTGSSDVIVAVIDTGVDYLHPDLNVNMWINAEENSGIPNVDDDGNGYIDDIYGYDFDMDDPDPMDVDGHGTHCAGTIGAVGNNLTGITGVSWNCRIMACKFINASDGGLISDAIDAVNYAVANGAKVLSNSWGGGDYSESLKTAIRNAGDHGVLFVAAAGNGRSDNDVNPFYPSSYYLSNVVSVAATDHSDKLAGFSNYGNESVHLGAPGAGVYSTVNKPAILFSEDFQSASLPGFSGTQMTPGGSNNFWGTIENNIGQPHNIAARGDYVNSYPYQDDSNGFIVTPDMDTRGLNGLVLQFDYRYDIDVSDLFSVEVYDGTSWKVLFNNSTSSYYSETYYYQKRLEIPKDWRNEFMKIRFLWQTDDSENGYFGVELDNISIQYNSTDYTGAYTFKSGTSMATPHVAGVAALLLANNPSVSLQELFSRLIMTGDEIIPLSEKTTTGRRLNAFNALDADEGMTVISPNGGEVWSCGHIHPIRWKSISSSTTVNIVLLKGGVVHSVLVNNVPNLGSWTWNLPAAGLEPGTDYRIRISDGEYIDDSNDVFSICEQREYLVELFDGTDKLFNLHGLSLMFTPNDSGSYNLCKSNLINLPIEPNMGTPLSLGDNDYVQLTLSDGNGINFYGTSYDAFYVGSNGYITFLSGDDDNTESYEDHFSQPRISCLFDDFDISSGGIISWQELSDRVVLTWRDVPEFNTLNSNTFQVEMFYDGFIRLSYLNVDALDGLVGLSDGSSTCELIPTDFGQSSGCYSFQADFESDVNGFTLDNDSGLGHGLWHRTNYCMANEFPHSSSYILYYGIDDKCNYNATDPNNPRVAIANEGTATTDIIDLSGATLPFLYFKYYLETEDQNSFDIARVEISTDGGLFEILADQQNGLFDPSDGWRTASIDLSAKIDHLIQLRFVFNTGDEYANDYSGWAIDDVFVYECNPEVNFADENLKTAVEDELGIINPTIRDMWNLTSLQATYSSISSLDGLEHARNIEFLDLSGNNIQDISPLTYLVNLRNLNLYNNEIVDILPLFNKKNLQTLDLQENNVSDISALEGISSLVYLILSSNPISDLSVVQQMVLLETLYLADLNITDISQFVNLVNLSDLSLNLNQINDISPLINLTNLRYLGLGNNLLSDISILEQLTKLENLSLPSNEIQDINTLGELALLTFIDLRYNEISNISPLANLTQLNTLYLEDNPLDTPAYCIWIPAIQYNNINLSTLGVDTNPNSLTEDCRVDLQELAAFLSGWLEGSCIEWNDWCNNSDLNHSGTVDFVDFAITGTLWQP
jgi:subtilisin family serine protease/Leucine-rich repeat (LRR) protein